MPHKAPSVEFPYRFPRRRDRALSGYDSLSLDEQQRLFDIKNHIPLHDGGCLNVPPDNETFLDMSGDSSSGVVGGCSLVKEDRTLYVNKNNYNPPTNSLHSVSSLLDGSVSQKDCEHCPPVPVTLAGVRRWCDIHANDPTYKRKDGSAWTAPDCTIGILRYRVDGRFAGFLPCGAWDCPVCGPLKRNKLNDKVSETFDQFVERGVSIHFLTLNLRVPVGKQTVHQSNPTVHEGYRCSGYVPQENIAQCFQRFRSILNKKGYFRGATGAIKSVTKYTNKFGTECTRTTRERTPTDQAYFYVKEFSPSSHRHEGRVTAGDRRHYHLLTNFDVPEDVIRDAWWYATDKTSSNVKMISETDEHGALRGRYITKYINKSMGDETFVAKYLPRERRYGKSVGLFTMAYPSQGLCFYQGLTKGFTPVQASETGYASCMDQAIHDPDSLPKFFSRQHPLA